MWTSPSGVWATADFHGLRGRRQAAVTSESSSSSVSYGRVHGVCTRLVGALQASDPARPGLVLEFREQPGCPAVTEDSGAAAGGRNARLGSHRPVRRDRPGSLPFGLFRRKSLVVVRCRGPVAVDYDPCSATRARRLRSTSRLQVDARHRVRKAITDRQASCGDVFHFGNAIRS